MNRVRVCEVVKTLNVGGVEVLLVERLHRAPRTSKHYTVICLEASTSELIARLRASRITVIDLTRYSRPLVYARLVLAVRRLSPDVLNVHSPLPAIALRPFVRLRRRRPVLVSTVHMVHRPTTILPDRLKTTLTMLLDRLTRGLDDRTVAVSSIVARSPAVRGARRVVTRVHGVDVAKQRYWARRSEMVRREFNVPDGTFLVVCVANFRPQKNHRMLVQAWVEVLKDRTDALLLLAGDGPLYDDVVGDVTRRGLDGRVRVLGHVPQANKLVAAADLLVLGSHYEGLPVVIMEALAAGVPVVCTDVGGVRDLIRPGENGILTEPGAPDALAAGILRAMTPAVHHRLRSGAAASAAAVDMTGTAEWFDRLYDEAAAKSRSVRGAPQQQSAQPENARTAMSTRRPCQSMRGRQGDGVAEEEGKRGE